MPKKEKTATHSKGNKNKTPSSLIGISFQKNDTQRCEVYSVTYSEYWMCPNLGQCKRRYTSVHVNRFISALQTFKWDCGKRIILDFEKMDFSQYRMNGKPNYIRWMCIQKVCFFSRTDQRLLIFESMHHAVWTSFTMCINVLNFRVLLRSALFAYL